MLALHKNEVFADRYLLRELIGRRSTSEVWLSDDTLDNQEVAIKIYAPLDRADQPLLGQLKQDVAADRSLHHPQLLPVYEFNVFDGSPYVVMPYLEQGSLKSKAYEVGGLSEMDAAILLKQVGSALQHLHSYKPPLLHQNIKPDNILIAGENNYMLASFRIHNVIANYLPNAASQSEMSTTAYAPPELFTVRPGTYKASDIFSFGVSLYQLCAGQLPWLGNGGMSLLQGAAVPYLPVAYSKELSNIVTACMDPKWENRPTADELVEEGDYYINNRRWKSYGRFSVAKVDVVQYEKSSTKKTVLWAIAILVALVALGFLLYTQTDIFKERITPLAADTATDRTLVSETTENGGNEVEETNTAEELPLTQEVPVTPAARPATPAPVRRKPVLTATPEREPEERRPAYSRPASVEQYVTQLQNKNISHNVREQWRQDVWRFFERGAAVNYVVDGELIGILSANELVDIMLDQERTTTIRIDSTRKNAAGKVNQIFVHVQ